MNAELSKAKDEMLNEIEEFRLLKYFYEQKYEDIKIEYRQGRRSDEYELILSHGNKKLFLEVSIRYAMSFLCNRLHEFLKGKIECQQGYLNTAKTKIDGLFKIAQNI